MGVKNSPDHGAQRTGNARSESKAGDGSEERPPLSLTDRILEQFAKTLQESGALDQKVIQDLMRLARAESKPKAKAIEELLQREEPLE